MHLAQNVNVLCDAKQYGAKVLIMCTAERDNASCAHDPVRYTQFALRSRSLLVCLVVSFSVAIKRL